MDHDYHAGDPRQTAQDLRVAAHVVEVAGHAKGQEVAQDFGSVCLLGALGIATGVYGIETHRTTPAMKNMVNSRVPYTFFSSRAFTNGVSRGITGTFDTLPSRMQNAITALAEAIPVTPDLQKIVSRCPTSTPDTHIYAWNDYKCDGNVDAQRLLLEAAEKVEANAGLLTNTTEDASVPEHEHEHERVLV